MQNEISARDEALSMYSDIHKDAYGFRPREHAWERVMKMTDAELEEEIHYLSGVAAQEAALEDERESQAETEIGIAHEALMKDHGVSAGTAWSWLIKAQDNCYWEEENVYDVEHFVWAVGVGCGKRGWELTREINAALKEDGLT